MAPHTPNILRFCLDPLCGVRAITTCGILPGYRSFEVCSLPFMLERMMRHRICVSISLGCSEDIHLESRVEAFMTSGVDSPRCMMSNKKYMILLQRNSENNFEFVRCTDSLATGCNWQCKTTHRKVRIQIGPSQLDVPISAVLRSHLWVC